MNLSIKSIIYQAIFEDKWLRISYTNKDGECTEFFIGINDIDEWLNIGFYKKKKRLK